MGHGSTRSRPARPGGQTPPPPAPKPQLPSPNDVAGAALVAQAADYTKNLGTGISQAAPAAFSALLNSGAAPADVLQWFKEFADRLKSEGRTFYAEETGSHAGDLTLTDYLYGRLHGQTLGDAATTTADDVRKWIQVLRANERDTWADIKAGTLTRETSNLDNIEAQLRHAGLTPTGGA